MNSKNFCKILKKSLESFPIKFMAHPMNLKKMKRKRENETSQDEHLKKQKINSSSSFSKNDVMLMGYTIKYYYEDQKPLVTAIVKKGTNYLLQEICKIIFPAYPSFLHFQAFHFYKLGNLEIHLGELYENDAKLYAKVEQMVKDYKAPKFKYDLQFFFDLKEKLEENQKKEIEKLKNETKKLLQNCMENQFYEKCKIALPCDIWRHIFSFWDIKDLFYYSGVCREWMRIITCPPNSEMNPIIEKFAPKRIFKGFNYDEYSKLFKYILSRFGHNLKELNCSWCIGLSEEVFPYLEI